MRLVQDYPPKELDVEESIVEGVFPSLMKAHFEFIILIFKGLLPFH